MTDINELRRLTQEATPGPWYIGSGIYEGRNIYSVEAVTDDEGFTYNPVVATAEDDEVACWDANARLIAAANPAGISELLDRLEAAEADAAHQKALADSALRVAEGWEEKCNSLHAKIAEMEKQEPVAWYSKQYGFVYMSRHSSQFEHGSILYLRNGTPAWRIEGSSRVALLNMASLPHGTVFYALPGSKGEEK